MIASTAPLPVITPASTNPANEIAKKLTGRDYVSWSAISTFRTCPLKYRFRYIDGLPEESVSSALVFGSGIHSSIESHYQAILSGEEQPVANCDSSMDLLTRWLTILNRCVPMANHRSSGRVCRR